MLSTPARLWPGSILCGASHQWTPRSAHKLLKSSRFQDISRLPPPRRFAPWRRPNALGQLPGRRPIFIGWELEFSSTIASESLPSRPKQGWRSAAGLKFVNKGEVGHRVRAADSIQNATLYTFPLSSLATPFTSGAATSFASAVSTGWLIISTWSVPLCVPVSVVRANRCAPST